MRTANWWYKKCEHTQNTSTPPLVITHKLDDLDEHPVVCARSEQSEQFRCERQVLSRVFSRRLADDVDRRPDHAHVFVAQALAEPFHPGVLAALLSSRRQFLHARPAVQDPPQDQGRLSSDERPGVGQKRQEIWSEVASEWRSQEESDGGKRRSQVGDGESVRRRGEHGRRRRQQVLHRLTSASLLARKRSAWVCAPF